MSSFTNLLSVYVCVGVIVFDLLQLLSDLI